MTDTDTLTEVTVTLSRLDDGRWQVARTGLAASKLSFPWDCRTAAELIAERWFLREVARMTDGEVSLILEPTA